MNVFDTYIVQTKQYIQELKNQNNVKEIFDIGNVKDQRISNWINEDKKEKLILRKDTSVELGNPENGSCAYSLWTDNISLIEDGKITLIGSDILESAGRSLPFAQVLLFGGKKLDENVHSVLTKSRFMAEKIEGYMLKSTPQYNWARVSKQAVKRGFCFEILGKSLISLFKSKVKEIDVMEIIFVTSGKTDVMGLESLRTQVQKVGMEIEKNIWVKNDFQENECDGLSCSSCISKEVCDNIRAVILERSEKFLE